MPSSSQQLEPSKNPEYFSIIQISDLHFINNATSLATLEIVLAELANYPTPIDLLVVSGDLVQIIEKASYDFIFNTLDKLNIPYICIAGNHDVTQELDSHLPFEQRRHVAMSAHPRLRANHSISTPHWQLLFCDTSIAGQIYGNFSEATLDWLAEQLKTAQKPCLLFCHHHVLPIHSAWLDGHITQNYPELWQLLTKFPQKLSAIFTGHVHQEQNQFFQGVAVYSVPSLSVQFLPFSDDFALDTQAKIGYRWIKLYNNQQLVTGVKRIDTASPN